MTVIQFSGEYRYSGSQINYQNCPVCGSSSWRTYLDPTTGLWFCFVGHHHAGGKVDVGLDGDNPGATLLQMLERRPETLEWPEIELPPWHALSRQAARYLAKRGLDAADIARLGLVEWEDQHRVLIPYFQDGDLVYWTSRRYSTRLGEGPKYWSQGGAKPLYRPFLRGAPSEKLVLVEGVFDAIAIERAGYHAVALGGKTLPHYHEKQLLTLAARYGTIDVLLDEDALAKAIDLQADLQARMAQPVRIVSPPSGMDAGDLTPDAVKEVLR